MVAWHGCTDALFETPGQMIHVLCKCYDNERGAKAMLEERYSLLIHRWANRRSKRWQGARITHVAAPGEYHKWSDSGTTNVVYHIYKDDARDYGAKSTKGSGSSPVVHADTFQVCSESEASKVLKT